MEESGWIVSNTKIENNKKMKYFKVTSDGKYLLDYMYSRFDIIHSNYQWNLLFEDMD